MTAARICVRSAMNPRIRSCMVLKARRARCTSTGPVTSSGGWSMSRPKASTARVMRCSGRIASRTTIQATTAMMDSSKASRGRKTYQGGRSGRPLGLVT